MARLTSTASFNPLEQARRPAAAVQSAGAVGRTIPVTPMGVAGTEIEPRRKTRFSLRVGVGAVAGAFIGATGGVAAAGISLMTVPGFGPMVESSLLYGLLGVMMGVGIGSGIDGIVGGLHGGSSGSPE